MVVLIGGGTLFFRLRQVLIRREANRVNKPEQKNL